MSLESFEKLLKPLLSQLPLLDLENHESARLYLNQNYPIDGLWAQSLKDFLLTNIKQNWLFPNEHRGIRFGRLDEGETTGFTIDSVDMDRPGPSHLHVNGEVDLAFRVDGTPEFDGNKEGWTVYPPNSWHRPTVQNGRMLVLYFLPDGGLQFCREAPEGAKVF